MPPKRTGPIPLKFREAILDFVQDLTTAFPEHSSKWAHYSNTESLKSHIRVIFDHCLQIYPERFFDILYQNDAMFGDTNIKTEFLPGVDFKMLYHAENVSETTRTAIWKYLQLLLFSLMSSVKNMGSFKDAQGLFEGIAEEDLQTKLMETFANMGNFFGSNEETQDEPPSETGTPPPVDFTKMFGMNPQDLHDHLKTLFDGKIGRMAKELAEELSQDFNDMVGGDIRSSQDVLKTMMRNPTKMMALVKKVSGKLNERMARGDITQDDIMKEAGEFFGQMKNNPQFEEMLKNMTKGMGKNAKIDMNALTRMKKQFEMKERARAKLEAKRLKSGVLIPDPGLGNLVFKCGEEQQNKSVKPVPQPPIDLDALVESIEGPVKKKTNKKNAKAKAKAKAKANVPVTAASTDTQTK